MANKKEDWFTKDTIIMLDWPYLPKKVNEWVTQEYNEHRELSNGSFIELDKEEIKNTPLHKLLKDDLDDVNKIIIKYWW